jgi:uncharacterized protein YdaU (DUF1376 family)
MKQGLDWYKRDPRAFIDGVQGLGPDLIGAYAVLLDLIYARGGETTRDDRHLSGLMGCSIRKATALTDALIERGKLEADGDLITNSRAKSEAKSRRKLSETRAKAGRKGGEKSSSSNEDNELQEASASYARAIEEEKEKEKNPQPPEGAGLFGPELDASPKPVNEVAEAVAIYNDAAQEVGWPVVRMMSPNRSKAMKARLRQIGGLDNWRIVVQKAKASDFLCGRTPKPWTGFSFDWLVKQANVAKVLEGNYANKSATKLAQGARGVSLEDRWG